MNKLFSLEKESSFLFSSVCQPNASRKLEFQPHGKAMNSACLYYNVNSGGSMAKLKVRVRLFDLSQLSMIYIARKKAHKHSWFDLQSCITFTVFDGTCIKKNQSASTKKHGSTGQFLFHDTGLAILGSLTWLLSGRPGRTLVLMWSF